MGIQVILPLAPELFQFYHHLLVYQIVPAGPIKRQDANAFFLDLIFYGLILHKHASLQNWLSEVLFTKF
jgi:hypothetical protein